MGFLDNLKDKIKDEINEASEERNKRKGTFTGMYYFGHPNVKGHNISIYIVLYDSELVVKQQLLAGENILFKLPYEKIDSTDITDASQIAKRIILPADAIMNLFEGKKVKGDVLQIVAMGKDKNDNPVKVPILLGDIRNCLKLKTFLDNEIGKAKGITI
jgi:hypothetical protein